MSGIQDSERDEPPARGARGFKDRRDFLRKACKAHGLVNFVGVELQQPAAQMGRKVGRGDLDSRCRGERRELLFNVAGLRRALGQGREKGPAKKVGVRIHKGHEMTILS